MIVSNLSRAVITFLTGVVVARGMGPAQFGDFTFLLGSFVAIRQFLDAGTSTTFVTFVSQRQRSWQFMLVYFGWLLAQFLLPFIAIALILPAAWIDSIWLGQDRGIILLAFIAVFLQQQAWLMLTQIGDALRETYKVQGLNLGVVAVHLILTVALWRFDALSANMLFVIIAMEYLVAIAIGFRLFIRGNLNGDHPEDLGTTIRTFLSASRPLVAYSWLGFAFLFADNWFLRAYGGSAEQAYYSVGYQFAMLCTLPTSAMLQIYWKEIAEAHERGDKERVAYLFEKVSRFLYAAGVGISCFFIPWTAEILQAVYGPSYALGAQVLAAMLFFPIHISLSQVASTLLLATGRAAVQARIGMWHMGLSIAASYLLLAPSTAGVPGLGLGAEGMALKLIVAQLLTVNFTLWWIARLNAWSFVWDYQVKILVPALLLGWLAKGATASWMDTIGLTGIFALLPAAVIYGCGIVVLFLRAPVLCGVTQGEVETFFQSIIHGRR